MNKQKQFEAMAVLEGYEFRGACWFKGTIMVSRGIGLLPDYDSHDALQRVIDGFDYGMLYCYSRALRIVIKRDNGDAFDSDDQIDIMALQATPAQKREAILKAKGLWEEGK